MRKTSPTAMGLYPPPCLLVAKREAPHRCGTTQEEMAPLARMETKLCRAPAAVEARLGEGQKTASLTSATQRPEGPEEVPVEKEHRHLITILIPIEGGCGGGERGRDGGEA